jgi:chemotaxis family two-component system sensor kinase Cph1
VFSVQDNGLGFNPVYAERVFKPFERLNGRQYPGSGLGLTLARRIAEQHGGRVWAESQLGQGSTFWFTLPVAD